MASQCARCLLPDTMPGISFNEDGLCRICQETPGIDVLARERQELKHAIENLVDRHRGARPYEAIVAYSGGKDSSYTLKYLCSDLGLRCLAITIDNGFLSTGVWDNCRGVCDTLGVDHVFFKPSSKVTERLYRVSAERPGDVHAPASAKRASAICSSCICLINTHMLQRAYELRTPIIAGGYLGGQVPRGSAMIPFNAKHQARARDAMVTRFVSALGEEARPYFELSKASGDDLHEVAIINPMLAISIDEDALIKSLAPLGWQRPADTGLTSTNCQLNDLGVYLHTRQHGYHPYAMEIAEQLREGSISRERALEKLNTLPVASQVQRLSDRIGLELHDD